MVIARILSRCSMIALVMVSLLGGRHLFTASLAQAASTPTWAAWDAGSHTATLTVIAAYNATAGGFNFDGYNNGGLTISVPTGAKVVVMFSNKAALPHSAVITPFASHTLAANFPTAFAGSATPNPTNGITSASKPQTFSFTAAKAGTYALVCGVPGHAVGGMWIVFKVAAIARPMVGTGGAASGSNGGSGTTSMMTMCGHGDAANGALAGTVTDASSGKPIAHVFIVVGWTTAKMVGETDAMGQFCVQHIKPVKYIDAFGFAQGYIYYHGQPVTIHPGKTLPYSFKLPRQAVPSDQLPLLAGAAIDHTTAAIGNVATFSVHVTPGKGGKMSAEVFAVNSTFGTAVLLEHRGSDIYVGSFTVPAGAKPGAYTFTYFGAMHNCLENARYLTQVLTVTK